jgi:hypothetical protein
LICLYYGPFPSPSGFGPPLTPRSIPIACVTAHGKAADNCWTVAGLDSTFQRSAQRPRAFLKTHSLRHDGRVPSLPPPSPPPAPIPRHCFLVRKSVRDRVLGSPAITRLPRVPQSGKIRRAGGCARRRDARIELFFFASELALLSPCAGAACEGRWTLMGLATMATMATTGEKKAATGPEEANVQRECKGSPWRKRSRSRWSIGSGESKGAARRAVRGGAS